MRIALTGVFVVDQPAALAFSPGVLGVTKKTDIPMGEVSCLTVVSADDADGPEPMLEPSNHPAVGPYRDALAAAGIPAPAFAVDSVEAEHSRLVDLGVKFVQAPTEAARRLSLCSTTHVGTSS